MSKESIPSGSSFDNSESRSSPTEKRIQRLFRRAGWANVDTREARQQTLRDEFQNLFINALLEENSPYKIHEEYSKKESYYTIAITKDNNIIAAKTSFHQNTPGEPNVVYNLVRQTSFLRRDLVFQLIEFSPDKQSLPQPIINIGYYQGEEEAQHIVTD